MVQSQGQSVARVVNHGTGNANANSNVGGSSPSVVGSGSVSTKKGTQKPSGKSQGGSGLGGGSPLKAMELAPAPRRKRRKSPEKSVPDNIAALLPESALYTQLVELELKMDAAIARKKMDMEETVKKPPHSQKTLRIYVFNTYANQTLMPDQSTGGEAPTWTLKLIGKILDDKLDPRTDNVVHKNSSYPKFSSFFKKITIYLDPTLYPGNHIISWVSSRSPALHEGFEVKRKGDKEFTAIIRLEMNYFPEKFRLSAALTQVLGLEVETRVRVVTALWHYAKLNKLQDPDDPSFFTCDPPLRKVFGEEKVKFTTATQKLAQHLSPLQPVQLEHRVKVLGSNPSGQLCYDVHVDVPLPLEKDMSDFLASTEKCEEIDDYDDAISGAIKKINAHRQRWAFFQGVSQSPAEFINTLIASQYKDLKVIADNAIHDVEKERQTEFFNQSWVEDGVVHYLNRKQCGGNESAGST